MAEPLYERIIAELSARILSGEWPPGHRLPFENELAAQYGCSRMTANKAMAELARAGLIERRRKAGSVVRRPRSQAALLEIHDIRAEVEALGLAYSYRLLSRSLRMAALDREEDAVFPAGAHLLELRCLHRAAADPFCLEERLICRDVVPRADAAPFEEKAPGPWLLGEVPWSEAEHRIRAVAASERVARLLGLSRGDPCLVVERSTWSEGRAVTSVRLAYRGDTHSLVARFRPHAR